MFDFLCFWLNICLQKIADDTAKKPLIGDSVVIKPIQSQTNGVDIPEDIGQFYEKLIGDEDDDSQAIKNLEVLSFEINQDDIETVQKRCIDLELPLLAEYDFRNDTANPSLGIDLKPATTLR